MWLPMNATHGQRDIIEALCSGTMQRMLIDKTATACALISREEEERSFNAVGIACIDDLFRMTLTVERKRI